MWLSECQPLNRNRIWHACTQLKKCELPHRVFDLNVTCHQEKAWSNISRAIIECYKQLVFIHWHSLSSPFHFKCLVIEIHWMWEMPQAGQHLVCRLQIWFAGCSSYRKAWARSLVQSPPSLSSSQCRISTAAHGELRAHSTAHIQGLHSCKQARPKGNKRA